MSEKAIELQQLVTMTHTMLDKAKAGLWEEVMTWEAQRSELISAFFQQPLEPPEASALADGLRELARMDNEIIAMGEVKRAELGEALQKMDQGKKAIKAYSE